MEQERWEKAR